MGPLKQRSSLRGSANISAEPRSRPAANHGARAAATLASRAASQTSHSAAILMLIGLIGFQILAGSDQGLAHEPKTFSSEVA